MPHVVQCPIQPFIGFNGTIEVHQVPAAQDNLCWVLVCTATGEAAVVDGPNAEAVLAYVEARDLTLTTVLNTHTHGDHIGINLDLARRGLLADMKVFGPTRAAKDVPGLTHPVDEGDLVQAAGSVSGWAADYVPHAPEPASISWLPYGWALNAA